MKNILFLLSAFWLWWTEKTAYIFMKALKWYFNVFSASIFKWGERYSDFCYVSKDYLVAEWNYWKIKDFVTKHRIDVVYMHWISWYKNSCELIELLSWLKNNHIKIVETSPFSLHTPDTEQFLDYKLFVSKTSLLKFLCKYNNPNITKYDYLYNPIDIEIMEKYRLNDVEKFKNREKYWINKNDFVLWKVWRADIVKWDDMIIDIVPLLASKIKNLKIVIRSLPDCKWKKIKKMWIEKYFTILPETVDEKSIAETYQLFDIMVHTSRIWESFWIALVEGMFYWLPILTTSTDRNQWLFFDKDNSQYEILGECNKDFINNDKKYIAWKILELYSNPSLRQEIWNKNKVYSLKYSSENLIKKLISILDWSYKINGIQNLKKEFNLYKEHCICEKLNYRLKYWIKWLYEMSFKNSFPFR